LNNAVRRSGRPTFCELNVEEISTNLHSTTT
jgi:hypothetical protein